MLGALYGDIVGSRFEHTGFNNYDFLLLDPACRITDDSLMTLAVALSLVVTRNDRENLRQALINNMVNIAHKHPNVGWGLYFYKWLFEFKEHMPIYSFGNGAAMRISPVGWVCNTLEDTIELSRKVTEITHNHPEGIKGAEAVAVAIYMARTGESILEIKNKMISYYPEIENMSIAKLKKSGYGLDEFGNWVTCQGSVPQAICAFLESNSVEDTIRKAISLGADADTQAAIAGSIAEAYYGISYEDEEKILKFIPEDLKGIYFAFDLIKKKRVNR